MILKMNKLSKEFIRTRAHAVKKLFNVKTDKLFLIGVTEYGV